jgi:hypothetical protein
MRRWYTSKTNVDIETGEILSDSAILRGHYDKVGKEESIEYKKDYNIKKITYYYERSKQQRLFD